MVLADSDGVSAHAEHVRDRRARTRPRIIRASASPWTITGHGHHGMADMGCVVVSLRHELDDHHVRACTSPAPEVWEHDPVMQGCEDWDGCCSIM
jgi:hypothetical protein